VTCLESPLRTFAPLDRRIPVLELHTMAETNAELQAKLQELEHELDEGDITTKGSVTLRQLVHCRRRVKWRVPRNQR
jgi:hypothetical protein